MAKFSLAVKPTFKAKIQMPVHGGDSVELEFEFKHRTRDQLAAWGKTMAKMTDLEMLEDILVGWNIEDPFNRESLELLIQNFYGAPMVLLVAYHDELKQARQKN
jgi:hypothetical protein